MDTFSARLRAYISEHGLTQKQVGEMAGIAQTTVSAYLSGAKSPSLESLRALSVGLGVSVGWLCGDAETAPVDWKNGAEVLTVLHGAIDTEARRWGFTATVRAGEEGPVTCLETADPLLGEFFINVLQARRLFDSGTINREMYDAIIDRYITKYSAADKADPAQTDRAEE